MNRPDKQEFYKDSEGLNLSGTHESYIVALNVYIDYLEDAQAPKKELLEHYSKFLEEYGYIDNDLGQEKYSDYLECAPKAEQEAVLKERMRSDEESGLYEEVLKTEIVIENTPSEQPSNNQGAEIVIRDFINWFDDQDNRPISPIVGSDIKKFMESYSKLKQTKEPSKSAEEFLEEYHNDPISNMDGYKWDVKELIEIMECYASKLEQDGGEDQRLRNLLEDVINELELSDDVVQKHGPLGTPPAELVRLVLEQKDLQIRALKAGMKQIEPPNNL